VETEKSLEQHAQEWETLAEAQPDTPAGRSKRATYLRAAESLRIEAKTGVAVCVCCYKPFGRGTSILDRS
jgi:hypothetical protein